MKCNDILLEDYVEGFLNTAEKTELETHLSSCNKCQQTLENLRIEQRLLATTLNETQLKSSLTENLMQEIKQQKKIKASRLRYKMMFITAAILMISFTLIATMDKPSQHADVLPLDTSQGIEANKQHATDTKEEPSTYGIPLEAGPVLDIKIDSVIEKDGMKEISYRANYNEAMQQYSERTLRKLVSAYQLEALELTRPDFHARISFNIRNSKNEVVSSLLDMGVRANDSIQPIYEINGRSSQTTEIFGERIKRFSLPVDSEPATFEITQYLAQIPTFVEPFTFKKNENTSFDYLGHTYTIYDTQLRDDGLQLSISVEGQPEIIPSGWYITVNGTRQHNTTFRNDQSIFKIILPGMQTIPEEMTMLPYLGIIHENLEPSIILDLKEIVNK